MAEAMPIRHRLVICSEDGAHLFLDAAEKGWTLPAFEAAEAGLWQETEHLNAGVEAAYGLKATTLRCLGLTGGRNETKPERIYALAARRDRVRTGRWLKVDEALRQLKPSDCRWLEAWQESPGNVVPWAEPGWWPEAHTWVEGRLADLGLETVGEAVQLRSWERSALYRIGSTGGDFYFKAQPRLFAHELPLLRQLAPRYGAHLPRLAATEPDRVWSLSRDTGGETLSGSNSLASWIDSLRLFGAMQASLSEDPVSLLACGLPDRRPEVLFMRMDTLFSDLESYDLSELEIAGLRERLPALKQICQRLAAYPIPASLEHGDLWPGNVTMTEKGPVFLDWSDSTLSHPFFSVAAMLDQDVPEAFLEQPEARAALRKSYLSSWSLFGSWQVLENALGLAERLAPVHFASLYHDRILPAMKQVWEMEPMVPFYLRQLLKSRKS